MNKPVDGFINPYVFSPQNTDVQNMAIAAKYLRARQEGGVGLSGWLHDVAKRFNDPINGILAADKFKGWAEATVLDLRLRALKDNLLEWVPDDNLFSLKGTGAFANAFKRIDQAMRFGADLVNSETTVSLCQKYVTKYNADLKAGNEAKMKRDQLGRLAVSRGLAEGTPEYTAFIEENMAVSRPAAVGTQHPGEEHTSEVKDRFSEAGEKFADYLRTIAQDNENLANEQITAITNKLDGIVKSIIARLGQQALKNAQQNKAA